jgi:hypothetical protein
MIKTIALFLMLALLTGSLISQEITGLKLTEKKSSLINFHTVNNRMDINSVNEKTFQLKKRKTVNSYFGAGYSFIIFTNEYMSASYPVLDTRNGTFLTNLSIFFGFAIAKAVALEIEPALLFASSQNQVNYHLSVRFDNKSYAHTIANSIFALPAVLNVRFFPLFKQKGFSRLIFLGGGVGAIYINENNDVYFNDNPNTIGGSFENDTYIAGFSSNQWSSIQMMAGLPVLAPVRVWG